jgi:hypothetical protein
MLSPPDSRRRASVQLALKLQAHRDRVLLDQENVSRLAGKEIQVVSRRERNSGCPAGKVFPPETTRLGACGCRRFGNSSGRAAQALIVLFMADLGATSVGSVAHLRHPRTAVRGCPSIALERVIERQSSAAGFSPLPALTSVRISQAAQTWPEGAAGWIREDPFDRRLPLPHTLSYTRIFEIPIAIYPKACNFFFAAVRRACDDCVCNLSRDTRKLICRGGCLLTAFARACGLHTSSPVTAALHNLKAPQSLGLSNSVTFLQSQALWG